MTLLNEDGTSELVDGMKAARNAAHELVGGQLTRGRARLRSVAKTRKSAQTRRRIMDAASELMMERGDTSFQMSEVSERCRMSKGSLYYYFRDRDELIGAIFDEYVDELIAVMEQIAATAPSAREALGALYAEFSRRLLAGTPLSLAMTHGVPRESYASLQEVGTRFALAAKVIAAQLERGKTEGFIREDVNAEAVSVFALGGLLTTSMAFAAKAETDAEAVSASLLQMMLQGVGRPTPAE